MAPTTSTTPVSTVRLRSDLLISRQGTADKPIFVIKDPASGRFFRFGETEHFIAQQLDGATSPETVRERVAERFGISLPPEVLDQFVVRLRTLGLVTDRPPEADFQPHAPRRIGGDVFYIRFKAFDPDRFFSRLVNRIQFLFTPAFVVTSAALIVFALGLTALNWAEMSQELVGLINFESLLLLWVTVLLVVTLHEFAHGLTCKHFGGHVHEVGFLLIYFQPAFYCNVSDAWLFPEKSKRLWVTFAGAYFEMFLWALSTVIWRLTDFDTTLNHLALVVTATSAVKSLFNLNPLIKLDGYYVLSDYLEIPNLRRRAFQYLGAFAKSPVGVAPAWLRQVPARERRIYLVYGLLAGSYSYWILALVAVNVGGYLVARHQARGSAMSAFLLLRPSNSPA